MTRTDYEVSAERFVNAVERFRELMEIRYQRKFNGARSALSFAIDKRNTIVERNSPFLDVCIDLRNSIQHNQVVNGRPIASPRPDILERLERLIAQIENPPSIKSHMITPKCLASTSSLSEFATMIHEHNFSQVPIYTDDGYTSLVTTNMLARWLARSLEQGEGDLLVEDATLSDILLDKEDSDEPEFVSPTEPAIKVCNQLSHSEASPAILITDTGHKTGKLLGIVTRFDVPKILRELQI